MLVKYATVRVGLQQDARRAAGTYTIPLYLQIMLAKDLGTMPTDVDLHTCWLYLYAR